MTSGGSISLDLLLNTSGFAGGMNAAVAMLGTFQRAKDAAFKADAPHLNTSGFAGGMNAAVAMLGTFQRAKDAAFKADAPQINVAQFQAEITGLNSANQTFQDSIREAAGATTQMQSGLNNVSSAGAQTAVQNVKLAGTFQNVALATVAMQGYFGYFQIAKSLIGNLIAETNKLQSAMLGLQSIAKFKAIKPEDATKSIQGLQIVRDGLISVGDASAALKNLLATGFSLEQSIQLMKRFGDAAAFNRQGSLDFGYAIVSATEGLKNQNSVLVDNVGISKNLSLILREMGYSEQDLMRVGSDLSLRTALYNGLLRESQGMLGDAARYANTFAGEQARLEAQTTKTKQELGLFAQFIGNDLINTVTQSVSDINKMIDTLKGINIAGSTAADGLKWFVKFGIENTLLPGLGVAIEQMKLLQNGLKDISGNGSIDIEKITNGFPKGSIFDQMKPDWVGKSEKVTKSNEYYETQAKFYKDVFDKLAVNDPSRDYNKSMYEKYSKLAKTTSINYGSTGSNSKTELDTDYSRTVKELEDTEKEFAKLKTELDAQHIAWNKNTKIIRDYIKAIDDLKKKIEDMKFDTGKVQTAIDNGSKGLLPGTITGRGERTPIELMRGDGTTPMSRFLKSAKTKEEASGEAQSKELLSNMQQFNGGLMGMVNSLGLADTGIGQFTNVVSGGINALNSFVQFLNSFGGGGGFDLLGLLFGAGLNMIAPGVGSVVGGALSGGGGMGGSIRNNSGGGFMGNLRSIISGSQNARVIQQPYIADFTGSGDKLRIVLKSADAKYNRMKGKAD